MAVVARKRKRGVVYFVTVEWAGRQIWERSGTDEREADRLDKRRKREVKAGTYIPRATSATLVGSFARSWFKRRKTRNLATEQGLWDNHVEQRCEWFTKMRIEDVGPKTYARLVEELKQPYDDGKGGQTDLAPKSHALIAEVVRTMFQDAVLEEVILANPCVLKRGTLSRRARNPRTPYTVDEMRGLVSHVAIAPDQFVWDAMAFYTGERTGEICGRRWHDWDREPTPLGSLFVHTQYNDQPLKTDDEEKARPRMIPVHPELDRILTWWWDEGFELVYGRRPRRTDFIVPRRDDANACRTHSISYKGFARACLAARVEMHTVHSTRHSFITALRRRTPRKEIVEKITHNAKGDIIDAYTQWEWEPLCEVMALLPSLLSRDLSGGPGSWVKSAPAAGLEVEAGPEKSGNDGKYADLGTDSAPPKSRRSREPAAEIGAGQACGAPLVTSRAERLRCSLVSVACPLVERPLAVSPNIALPLDDWDYLHVYGAELPEVFS